MSKQMRDLSGVRRGTDIYTVDPRVLTLDYDWNSREDYGREDGSFDELKNYIRENGVPGIILGIKRGDSLVVTDGYRRITATQAVKATDTSGEAVELLENAIEIARESGKSKASAKHLKEAQESSGRTVRKPNLKRTLTDVLASAKSVDEDGQRFYCLSAEQYDLLFSLVEP